MNLLIKAANLYKIMSVLVIVATTSLILLGRIRNSYKKAFVSEPTNTCFTELIFRWFQAIAFGTLIIISIFLGTSSSSQLLSISFIIRKLSDAFSQRNEGLLWIFIVLTSVLGLPALFLQVKKYQKIVYICLPLTFFMTTRVIFQNKDISPTFYRSELLTGCLFSLIALSLIFTNVKYDYLLLKTVLLAITFISSLMAILSPNSVFTSEFTGGIGLSSRLQGILPSPTIYGYVASLGVIIYFLEYKRQKNFFHLTLLFTFFINALLSGSRGSLLTIFFGLLSYYLGKSKNLSIVANKYLFGLLFIFIAFPLANLTGVKIPGLYTRAVFYTLAREYFTRNNLTGVGPLNLTTKNYISVSYMHNQFLQTLVEYGWMGICILLISLFGWLTLLKLSSFKCNYFTFPIATWGILSLLVENSVRIHIPLYALTEILFLYMMKISLYAQDVIKEPFENSNFDGLISK